MNTFQKQLHTQKLARPILAQELGDVDASTETNDKNSEQLNKLAEAAGAAHDILFEANTVFPFTLFPDTIKIDRDKLIIIRRSFFGISNMMNVQLHDVQAIEANTGPFLGYVSITAQQFSNTINTINYLKKEDALKVQRLLQGFVIAHKKEIDYSQIETDKLLYFIENIGQGEDISS